MHSAVIFDLGMQRKAYHWRPLLATKVAYLESDASQMIPFNGTIFIFATNLGFVCLFVCFFLFRHFFHVVRNGCVRLVCDFDLSSLSVIDLKFLGAALCMLAVATDSARGACVLRKEQMTEMAMATITT